MYLILILVNAVLDRKAWFFESMPPTLSLSISSPAWFQRTPQCLHCVL